MKDRSIFREEDIRRLVIEALDKRRKTIVFGIAKRIEEAEAFSHCSQSVVDISGDDEWVLVESLSQLRGLVGGRFKNLKDKWISAGLPLRQHRGDRSGRANVNQEGWLALSLWVNKQGFEIRLPSQDSTAILEVRSLERFETNIDR